MTAKHEFMSKPSNAHHHITIKPPIPQQCFCSPRTTALFRRLRSAVEEAVGHPLTYVEISRITGEPRSTLGNWFNGDGEPSVEAVLRLAEMLPDTRRHDILDHPPVCRLFPRLNHPHLAHDPVAVSRLRTILSNPSGLMILRGFEETWLTFLAAAIAHSVGASAKQSRPVLGLDVHLPDWFVPVPDVTYLPNELRPERIRSEIERLKQKLASAQGALVVVNAGPSTTTLIDENFLALARQAHLVITDVNGPKHQQPPPKFIVATIVSVSLAKAKPERITLDIRTT